MAEEFSSASSNLLMTAVVGRRGQAPGGAPSGDTEVDSAEVPHVVEASVFASPSRIQVQGGRREAGGEAVVTAYPDICFAIDESHTGFDTLVSSHTDHL